MSFCQACGARNADDARFCNACGARIVKGVPSGAGPAPGAAAPASDAGATRPARSSGAGAAPVENVWAMQSQAGAPSPGSTSTSTTTGSTTSTGSGSSNTFSNQTLAGVGIPSQRHTYATLASIALGFLALGILLAWLVMRGGEHETTAEASVPTVPGEVAPTIPEGVEVPDDGAFVEGGRGGGSRGGGGRTGGSTGGGSTGGSTGATGGSGGAVAGGSGGSAGGTGATGGTGGATGGSGSGGTAGGGAGGSGSGGSGSAGGTGGSGSGGAAGGTGGSGTGGSGTGGSGTGGSGTGGSGTGGGERDWAAMGETVGDEPPDYDVSLYVSNVRRFIRNNYARQASSCFSRASAAGGSAVTGRVVIGFTISATGGTENVHVVRNEPGIDSLGSCLVNRVDSWDLPAPPRREPLSLEMPFSP